MILLLILTLAWLPLKSLRGRWRSWVMAPAVASVPLTWVSRSSWPYMLLCFAAAPTLSSPFR